MRILLICALVGVSSAYYCFIPATNYCDYTSAFACARAEAPTHCYTPPICKAEPVVSCVSSSSKHDVNIPAKQKVIKFVQPCVPREPTKKTISQRFSNSACVSKCLTSNNQVKFAC